MYPVLFELRFPEIFGQPGWVELLITALAIGLLYLWSSRKTSLRPAGFVFWVAMYAALRLLVWYAGPGYHFKLHTYGVMIALGFVVGVTLAVRQATREGVPADAILDLAFWILIASMVGSRILFILVNIDDYIAEPINLIKIWQGGLVFYGGFLAALAAAAYHCRRHQLSFFRIADILIPSVAIGHTFGRLGCFAAGCCHGLPTGVDHFGAVFQASATVVASNQYLGIPLHPTQLYEAFGELVIFGVLVWLRPRKRFHGQLLITYLLLYPILRSSNEMFRGDYERGMLAHWDLFGDPKPELLSTSQLISLFLAAVAIALLLRLTRRPAQIQTQIDPPGSR